jgi:hypothetical protein
MFNRVKPGQRWQPKADEVNAMLAAGAALRSVPGLSALTDTPPGNAVIRVKNITGDTIQRYRAFGLGESLVADLEDSSRVPEVVLELVEWESGPVAVIQQPLADDEIGFALVSGVTLLEVSDEGTETDRQATPGTDGVCDPGSGPITILMPRPEDGGFVLAAMGVGGSRVFPVTLAQVGGSQGTNAAAASWTYDVKDFDSDDVLEAAVNPTASPHKFKRPSVGQMIKATFGYAHYTSDGDLALGWINEVADQEACEE